MAGRSHRYGIGGRLGTSFESSATFMDPFKFSMDPPKINPNSFSYSSNAPYSSSMKCSEDCSTTISKLEKEIISLKLELYLQQKLKSQSRNPQNIDTNLNCNLDIQEIKDALIGEAIKTANASEERLQEAQSKIERLEGDLKENQKELDSLQADMEKAIKARDDHLKELKDELVQLHKEMEDKDRNFDKAKKFIQVLTDKLGKTCNCSEESKDILKEKQLEFSRLQTDMEREIKAKDDQLKVLKDELTQMQKEMEDKDLNYDKAKKFIQALTNRLKKSCKCSEGNKVLSSTPRSTDASGKDSKVAEMDSSTSEHYCEFKKELEIAKKQLKDLEATLVEKQKCLAGQVAEVSSLQKALERRDHAIHHLNGQLENITKSQESAVLEHERQMKELIDKMNELKVICDKKEHALQKSYEHCDSLKKRIDVRRNLSASFEDPGHPLSTSESPYAECIILKEGSLSSYSEPKHDASDIHHQMVLESKLQEAVNQREVIMSEYNITWNYQDFQDLLLVLSINQAHISSQRGILFSPNLHKLMETSLV